MIVQRLYYAHYLSCPRDAHAHKKYACMPTYSMEPHLQAGSKLKASWARAGSELHLQRAGCYTSKSKLLTCNKKYAILTPQGKRKQEKK